MAVGVGNVVKEYLVSLGYKVNKSEYAEFAGSIKKLGGMTEDLTSNLAHSVASASVTVAGFLASVTGGVAAFLDGIAEADMDTEKFAKRMWMTEEAARSLEIVLNAMGEDLSSMEDIAMNSELRKHFFALKEEAKLILPPSELQEKLKGIREIKFEFMRFRMIVSYGSQWVAYYLTTYLEKPLERIKATLKAGNDWLRANLQSVAQKVAKALMVILDLVNAVVWAISSLVLSLKSIWDSLSGNQKETAKNAGAAGGVIGALYMLIKLKNPFMLAVTAITTALFLIKDFYDYMQGKDSIFTGLWEPLNKVFGDKELLIAFEDALMAILDAMSALGREYQALDNAFKKATGMGIIEFFLNNVKDALMFILNTITAIMKVAASITDMVTKLINFINGKGFANNNTASEEGTKKTYGNVISAVGSSMPMTSGLSGLNIAKEIAQWLANPSFGGQLNPTYNIYGSDPKQTANEANGYNMKLLIRQARG